MSDVAPASPPGERGRLRSAAAVLYLIVVINLIVGVALLLSADSARAVLDPGVVRNAAYISLGGAALFLALAFSVQRGSEIGLNIATVLIGLFAVLNGVALTRDAINRLPVLIALAFHLIVLLLLLRARAQAKLPD